MPRQARPSAAPRKARAAPDTLRLVEAAVLLDLAPSTLRRYVKAGKLKASQAPGKYGAEYRIKPAVLKVFALETFNRVLSDEDLEDLNSVTHAHDSPPPSAAVVELYERLLSVTEEATRYRQIAERSESTLRESEDHYKAMIAELQARVAELQGRHWWRRGKP